MKKHTRMMLTLLTLAMVVAAFAVPAFAEGTTVTKVTSADWQSVIDAITAQINVADILAVIASIAGIAIALVFMWWGVRKVIRIMMGAFRKGKLSV